MVLSAQAKTECSPVTRILLIDDDDKLLPLLQRGLAYEGFEVYTAIDGPSGLEAARTSRPHIVLLDIAMPGPDGFEVCRNLRLRDDPAIIMLTARDDVVDKVTALNLGADDYVAKPFAFDELVARIHAVLRRHQAEGEPLQYANLRLHPETREVQRDGSSVELTTREYDLLLLFMRHPRQVLTRDQILERVWGYDSEADTNVLDVHIGHLRQKLEAQAQPRLIQTIRGIGYSLRE
jgi:two-component system, OmpR family, response regulator MprA